MEDKTTVMIPAADLEPNKIEILVGSFTIDTALLRVTDRSSLEYANDISQLGKNIIKAIGVVYDPLIAKARQPWDKFCADKRKLLARIEPEVKRLDQEAAAYIYEEKRKRLAAEEETRRLEAEKKRLQEQAILEAQKREDEARHQLALAEMQARQEERRAQGLQDEREREKAKFEAERIRLDAMKDHVKAEADVTAILDKAAEKEGAMVAAAPKVEEKIKLDGQVQRDHWVAEVIEADLVEREFCSPDPKKLATAAVRYRDTKKFPGFLIVNRPLMMKTK